MYSRGLMETIGGHTTYAIGATFAVSIFPVFLLGLIPSVSAVFSSGKPKSTKSTHQPYLPLNFMMCFAAGSLLADSLVHLSEDIKESEFYLSKVIVCLVGILVFFIIDRASRLHSHSHGHDHSSSKGMEEKKKKKGSEKMHIGFISLIADAVHNFTDGMAIAAAFGKSLKTGLTSSFAIFLHEIPHELGDYALLTKFGFSHADVIKWQLTTGAAAFAGVGFGLAVEGGLFQGQGVDWLLPFSCGGFLYLALCSILAEVLSDEQRTGVKAVVLDACALSLGVAIIFMMEIYY